MNQNSDDNTGAPRFTQTQGQYLAFIYAYRRINQRAPAEADMQRHFGVTPLLRDNQDEKPASIRMRMDCRRQTGGRA